MERLVNTINVEMTINYFSIHDKKKFEEITHVERIITYNGEELIREKLADPYFQSKYRDGNAIDEFEWYILNLKKPNRRANTRNNTRKFAKPVQTIWSKFLFKIFNFKK